MKYLALIKTANVLSIPFIQTKNIFVFLIYPDSYHLSRRTWSTELTKQNLQGITETEEVRGLKRPASYHLHTCNSFQLGVFVVLAVGEELFLPLSALETLFLYFSTELLFLYSIWRLVVLSCRSFFFWRGNQKSRSEDRGGVV